MFRIHIIKAAASNNGRNELEGEPVGVRLSKLRLSLLIALCPENNPVVLKSVISMLNHCLLHQLVNWFSDH